jgi:predicted nucleotidyltransferase
MDRDAVIAVLRRHRDELVREGIAHAALFGSLARNEAGPGSDIDVLVEFAPGRVPDLLRWMALRKDIAALMPGRVDIVDGGALRPAVREHALRDALHAF